MCVTGVTSGNSEEFRWRILRGQSIASRFSGLSELDWLFIPGRNFRGKFWFSQPTTSLFLFLVVSVCFAMVDQAAATIIFIWTVGVLVLKLQFVALCTSLKRRQTGSPVVPEDEALLGRKEHSTASGQSVEVERYLNLHRNDMENIYVFFFVSFFFIFSSSSYEYAYDAWTAYNLTFFDFPLGIYGLLYLLTATLENSCFPARTDLDHCFYCLDDGQRHSCKHIKPHTPPLESM